MQVRCASDDRLALEAPGTTRKARRRKTKRWKCDEYRHEYGPIRHCDVVRVGDVPCEHGWSGRRRRCPIASLGVNRRAKCSPGVTFAHRLTAAAAPGGDRTRPQRSGQGMRASERTICTSSTWREIAFFSKMCSMCQRTVLSLRPVAAAMSAGRPPSRGLPRRASRTAPPPGWPPSGCGCGRVRVPAPPTRRRPRRGCARPPGTPPPA